MLNLEHLKSLVDKHPEAARAQVREFEIGGKLFAFNARPHIMGVINLSPDSWYRESVCLSVDQAVRRAHVLAAQGADLIDLGAESTLLDATRVSPEAQQSILLTVLKELQSCPVPVSIETYDARVAATCLEAGAKVINVTGTDQAKEIYRLAAAHGAAVILCYVQGPNVRQVGDLAFAGDPLEAMTRYFSSQIELAKACGTEKLILDPGLGFYYRNLQDSQKRVQFQMNMFLAGFRLRTLGQPLGQALPHAFAYFGEEVRCAEPFFAVLAALGKTDLYRTHEVPKIKAVLDTLRAYAPAPG